VSSAVAGLQLPVGHRRFGPKCLQWIDRVVDKENRWYTRQRSCLQLPTRLGNLVADVGTDSPRVGPIGIESALALDLLDLNMNRRCAKPQLIVWGLAGSCRNRLPIEVVMRAKGLKHHL